MQVYLGGEIKFIHVSNAVAAIFLKRKIRESRSGIQYGGFNMAITRTKKKMKKWKRNENEKAGYF